MVLDRAAAIATWRAAEGRIYPSVMVNASLYQEYVDTIRAIAGELGQRPPAFGAGLGHLGPQRGDRPLDLGQGGGRLIERLGVRADDGRIDGHDVKVSDTTCRRTASRGVDRWASVLRHVGT